MALTKQQGLVIGGGLALLFLLAFGFDTRPRSMREVDVKRNLNQESTDVNALLADAKGHLDGGAASRIQSLESTLEQKTEDAEKTGVYKELSAAWFDAGQPALSGFYAEKAAEILMTDEAWSIAGTTYGYGLGEGSDEKVRAYCRDQAVKCLENAISIKPEEMQYQVNLALAYVQVPLADNPMKGVMMLRELNAKHPDNTLVLLTLARLAIQTGQLDKAMERVNQVLELEPLSSKANCLMAEILESKGDQAAASAFKARCKN